MPKPVLARCGNCKGFRYQTLLDEEHRDSPTPPVELKCNGCGCINAFEGGIMVYHGVTGDPLAHRAFARYRNQSEKISLGG